jgi:hypothetical protein
MNEEEGMDFWGDISPFLSIIECPVCNELPVGVISVLPCAHKFCSSCLSFAFMSEQFDCLVCQQAISGTQPDHHYQEVLDQFRRDRIPTNTAQHDDLLHLGGGESSLQTIKNAIALCLVRHLPTTLPWNAPSTRFSGFLPSER